MKRSRTASLVVMGLTPLLISACDDTSKSQQEFASVDACTTAGVPAATCDSAHNEALVLASQFAPHYSSESLCDTDFEQSSCVEGADGNHNVYWSPVMTAFLVGRVVRGSDTSYYPAGPIFHRHDRSDYSPRYGSVYSGGGSGGGLGGGGSGGGSGGWHAVSSEESAGEGDTVSRGGFGGGEGEGGHGSGGE